MAAENRIDDVVASRGPLCNARAFGALCSRLRYTGYRGTFFTVDLNIAAYT